MSFLGVADDADWPTVVAAWKQIALTCHPDRSPDPRDHHRYAQASAAYKQLREEHTAALAAPEIDPWETLDEFETLATGEDRPTTDDVSVEPVVEPIDKPHAPTLEPALTRRQMLGSWRRLVDRP